MGHVHDPVIIGGHIKVKSPGDRIVYNTVGACALKGAVSLSTFSCVAPEAAIKEFQRCIPLYCIRVYVTQVIVHFILSVKDEYLCKGCALCTVCIYSTLHMYSE